MSLDRFLNAVDPRRSRIRFVALIAYLDASVSGNHTCTTIAGFVATEPGWKSLTDYVGGMVENAIGINRFHMTDFVSKKGGWENWAYKNNSARRRIFMSHIVSAVVKHTKRDFCVSVTRESFDGSNSRFKLGDRFPSEYAIAGFGCLAEIRTWALSESIDLDSITCVFERGDRWQRQFILEAQDEGYDAVDRCKKNLPEFDIADIAAWRGRTLIDDVYARRDGKDLASPGVRESILSMMTSTSRLIPNHMTIGEDGIDAICEGLQIKRRTTIDEATH